MSKSRHAMLTLISIHTPLAGSDLSNQQTMQLADIFQSTLPLRGATRQSILGHGAVGISIHTPLAGSDSQTESKVAELEPFQSTLPLRGATDYVNACAGVGGISIHTPLAGSDRDETVQAEIIYISIHTPLAGSDIPSIYQRSANTYFNPHSPCGERPLLA